MVKLTKEDENKLGRILKELNEMKDVLKGGEGSGVKGHKNPLTQLTEDEKKPMSGDTMYSDRQKYKRAKERSGGNW